MKLIVGLGNYPEKYKQTRHNFGFLLIDFLAQTDKFPSFKIENKFYGQISLGEFCGEKAILLKPQTYMNLSGQSVQAVANFYKISPADIIVLSDDADLPFGTFRFRTKGSAGGHNGLRSIIQCLNTENFPRLKLGIANSARNSLPLDVFALQKFNEEELQKLPEILKSAYDLLLQNSN